jgi:uncharacterized protein (DUF697 family)
MAAISAGRIRKLVLEVESSGRGPHVLAVGGAPELAPILRQQLARGADPAAVRIGGPGGADLYLHVLVGAPGEADEAVLRRARRERVPVIAVAAGEPGGTIPYVFATDVVRVAPGRGFPLDVICRVIAARLDEDGAPLAARIPLLREAVSGQLVSSLARRNGVVAAAAWIRRADLPALALNELRLVLRLAQAHGEDTGREQVPDLALALGAAFGLRAVARGLLDFVPGSGWVIKAAVAYAGTRALGAASRKRYGATSTPRPDAAWPVAP